MKLEEAKEILNQNDYILTESYATVDAVAREIKKLLKTKYEIRDRAKLEEYMDDIVPFKVSGLWATRPARDYAAKLCRDYFNW